MTGLVKFPDGSVVRGRPYTAPHAFDGWPEFGLYLDPKWSPTWPAEFIDWPDFKLPSDPEKARQQIRAAHERAQAGERVEIGCLGGCGRTGTVLACMAILAGVPASEAVAWVRTHYRPDAVETPEQEEWVQEFAEHLPDNS